MIGGLASIVSASGFNGWAILLAYLLAAGLSARNARSSAVQPGAGARRIAEARSRRRFWLMLVVLLLFLGLTRLLDLQQLAANMMRGLLRTDGVYRERSDLQVGLIVAIGLFGAVGLLVALLSFRHAGPPVLVALLVAAILVVFTVIRTVSLHDIDRFLGYEFGFTHVSVNALIEFGLLGMIVAAGFLFDRGLRRENQTARLRALSIQERRRILAEKRRAARS